MSAQTTALPGGVAPRRLAAMSNGGVTSYAWLPGVAFIAAFAAFAIYCLAQARTSRAFMIGELHWRWVNRKPSCMSAAALLGCSVLFFCFFDFLQFPNESIYCVPCLVIDRNMITYLGRRNISDNSGDSVRLQE